MGWRKYIHEYRVYINFRRVEEIYYQIDYYYIDIVV